MKAVILAGGYGTRITEESTVRPKPMVEIGAMPILWHIMKIYSAYGINEFVICCGYKGHVIKDYFINYYLHTADITLNLGDNHMHVHAHDAEPWTVTLVETGEGTMTGGRLKRARPYIGDSAFCLTYGDGVSDVNVGELVKFHMEQGVKATVTAVQPPGRFGAFTLKEDECLVPSFREKPEGDGAWINGGFFVLEPDAIDYIEDESTVWEQGPMVRLAKEGQLAAYKHRGFWQPMDTLRDKHVLDDLWSSGNAPWKVW